MNTSSLTRRNFLGAASASAMMLALTACGGSGSGSEAAPASDDAAAFTLVKEGQLISVSDMECPPFSSYKEGTSDPEGFEIDMMAAVAEKLGLESVWLPKMDFDGIIPLIQQGGKADIGVANFTITDERAKLIDFTDPYYVANIGFVCRGNAEQTSTEDFNAKGIRVGAQGGTTGEAWALENLPNAEIVTMAPANAMLSVSGGGEGSDALDAMVADLPVVQGLISKSYPDLQILDEIATGDEFGIVVSKDNPGLTEALNGALAELEADGTMAALVEKWLAK